MPAPVNPADDHSRYENLPELSFDGLHARETLNGVTPVTRKFPGAVGLMLSSQAYAGKANASAKTIPIIRKLLNRRNLQLLVITVPFPQPIFCAGHTQTGSSMRMHEPHNGFPTRFWALRGNCRSADLECGGLTPLSITKIKRHTIALGLSELKAASSRSTPKLKRRALRPAFDNGCAWEVIPCACRPAGALRRRHRRRVAGPPGLHRA